MAHWNYRVVQDDTQKTPDGEKTVAIHEVHYREDGSIFCWTTNPVGALSEDMPGLLWVLDQMRRATTMPVLKLSDLRKIEEAG